MSITYAVEYSNGVGVELARWNAERVAIFDTKEEAQVAATNLEMAHLIPMTVVEVIESSVVE